MPADIDIIFLTEASALDENQSRTLIVFGVALLTNFLVLAAQFENFGRAIIIICVLQAGYLTWDLVETPAKSAANSDIIDGLS